MNDSALSDLIRGVHATVQRQHLDLDQMVHVLVGMLEGHDCPEAAAALRECMEQCFDCFGRRAPSGPRVCD